MKLASFDSPVVQLDASGSDGGRLLLVSTSRRTYVVDCVRALYVAVGKKPRDAPLGACFVPTSSSSLSREGRPATTVFAVRPGRRLWEAELDGRVTRTIQLPSGDLDAEKIVACLGDGDDGVRRGSEEPFLSCVVLEPRSGLVVGLSSYFVLLIRPENGHVLCAITTASSATILDVEVHLGSICVQYRKVDGKTSSLARFDVRVPSRATDHGPPGYVVSALADRRDRYASGVVAPFSFLLSITFALRVVCGTNLRG